MTQFLDLDLNEQILKALHNKGYTTPTPIQDQAIPHVLKGKDLLGIAQTGTGKTAAFSLPILNNLTKSNNRVKPNQIRCLILTPTRELASQISENIDAYAKDLKIRHGVIFGGVSDKPQIRMMSQGLDILIATPGRLLDLMSQGHIRYANLEIFVLDEADRMLDMGFIHDVKKIIKKLPEERQTLFFSATMPNDISNLADSILIDPVKVEVTPQATTVDRIDQRINFVAKGNKNLLLKKILQQDDVKNVLVFSKTKHGANRIVQYLEQHAITVAAIHGNKSQGARERALSGFKTGDLQVLVATDIAARGIDVPGISHVINFDIPIDPESYVHRIGRTARAGKEGIAITFCDPSEKSLLRSVEKVIKYQIPVDETHPLHGVESSSPYSKKSDFGPRFTNADRSRSKARGEKSRAANQAKKARESEEDLDLKFNQESANVNRDTFSRKPRTNFSKFGSNGKRLNKDASRYSSGKARDTGERSNNRSRSRNEAGSEELVSHKEGRRMGNASSETRSGNKGKNFSYAGVREKKFGGKKKPFGRRKPQ